MELEATLNEVHLDIIDQWGAKLSADHILQHRLVERQIRHDLLQFAILFLELAQPLHLRRRKIGYSLHQL